MDLDCRRCRELLPSFVDEALSELETSAVRAHLETCPTCERLRSELVRSASELTEGLGRLAAEAPPATALADRVRQALAGPPSSSQPYPERIRSGTPSLPRLASSSPLFFAQTEGEFHARFARILSMLLAAGRPVPRALELMAVNGDAGDRSAEVLELSRRTLAGHSLSSAMDEQPGLFPDYLREAVRAGEASGRLAEVLDRLSSVMETRHETRQRIIANLSYPATVMALMGGLAGFVSLFVLPKFARLFSVHQMELPLVTRALVELARFPAGARVLFVVIAGGALLLHLAIRRHGLWRDRIDRLKLRLPLYRAIHGQYLLGWFSSLTSVLISGGVPVHRALALSAAASENSAFGHLVREVQREVEAGVPLSRAVESSPIFPGDARQLIASGDETNRLPEAFAAVSRLYNERLACELKILVGVLEPLTILALGTLVAVYCFAIYSPATSLITPFTRN